MTDETMLDDKFMFLLPILCTDCGEPIGDNQLAYTEGRKAGESHESLLDRFGYENVYCCAIPFTSPIQIPYGAKGTPMGSIAETAVAPEMIQIWSGTMSMPPPVEPDADIPMDNNTGEDEIFRPDDNMIATYQEAEDLDFGDLGVGPSTAEDIFDSMGLGSAIEDFI